jgi:hypothetical protein
MKKIFYIILLMTLIFSLCCIQSFATAENPQNEETPEIESDNALLEDMDESSESEEADEFYSAWIDKITDSTLWINIGTIAIACLGVVGTVASKFKDIASLISKKADASDVAGALKYASSDICDSFKNELSDIKSQLQRSKDNEEMLLTILTLFVTNAKINNTAKAEIMKYLSGIEKISGSVEDIVSKANDVIAKAEASETAIETPALDAIVSESSDYMELG